MPAKPKAGATGCGSTGRPLKPTSKKSKKQKPFWERAYQGHAYWLGKGKLGKGTPAGKNHYERTPPGPGGSTPELDSAKKTVELALPMADKQLDLFSEGGWTTGPAISLPPVA